MTDLERAIEKIREVYARYENIPYIKNPVAYALYIVWREVDRETFGRKSNGKDR